jgi:hypothetical protein
MAAWPAKPFATLPNPVPKWVASLTLSAVAPLQFPQKNATLHVALFFVVNSSLAKYLALG